MKVKGSPGFVKELTKTAKDDYKGIILRLILLSTLGITSLGYVWLNNFRGKVYHIPTNLDTIIEFNKYFIVPYIYWYAYLGFFLGYYLLFDGKRYLKILMGINIGMIISFIIFYFFPTTVPRPIVGGSDIFIQAVNFIYSRDNPYNCFPSIHVLDAVLIAAYINRDGRFSPGVKMFSSLISFSIILSTMFIKQHYVYDAIGGAFIAYFMYIVFNYREVSLWLAARLQLAPKKTEDMNGEQSHYV